MADNSDSQLPQEITAVRNTPPSSENTRCTPELASSVIKAQQHVHEEQKQSFPSKTPGCFHRGGQEKESIWGMLLISFNTLLWSASIHSVGVAQEMTQPHQSCRAWGKCCWPAMLHFFGKMEPINTHCPAKIATCFLGAELPLNVHQLVGKALQFNSTFYLQESAKIIIVPLLSLVEHNNEMENRWFFCL